MLKLENITKKYGEFTALNNFSMEVKAGEILGIVGENGSGKSTLLKTIYGSEDTRDYEGKIILSGKDIKILKANEAEKIGIGMVHQELSLVEDMNISENIKITRENTKYWGYIDKKKDELDSKILIDKYNINADPKAIINSVSLNIKQYVEIIREVHKANLKILILDEATASLGKEDSLALMKIIKQLAEKGLSVIFVSHKLEEIYSISDRIIVLRDGEKVFQVEKNYDGFDKEKIVKAMVGRKIVKSQRNLAIGNRVLANKIPSIIFSNVEIKKGMERLIQIDLEIYEGEIFGVIGLSGHGKSLLGYGVVKDAQVKGEIRLGVNRELISNLSTKELIKRGIVFMPDERKDNGLMLNSTIENNMTVMEISSGKSFVNLLGIVKSKKISLHSKEMIKKLNIKCEGPHQKANRLSGGNQQKICIGRAITGNPKLIFVGEPTRGIDIYSKEVILNTLIQTSEERNITLVISSSEIDELMRVCDRIAVVYEGRIVDVFLAKEENYEKIGLAIAGVKENLSEKN